MLVLRIAEDWAGIEQGGRPLGPQQLAEEPWGLVQEACALTGRPAEELYEEFQQAKQPIGAAPGRDGDAVETE